jgi:hypothetical protein
MKLTVFGYNKICKQFINTFYDNNYYCEPELGNSNMFHDVELTICNNIPNLKYPDFWKDIPYAYYDNWTTKKERNKEIRKGIIQKKHITSELIKNTDIFISFSDYLYENETIMTLCKMYNVKFIYVGNIGTMSIIYSDSDEIINYEQQLLHVYHLAINKFIKKYKIKPFNDSFTHLILYFSNCFYNELFGENMTVDEYYIIKKYCDNQKKCNFLMYYTIYNLYIKIFNEKKNYNCKNITLYKYHDYYPLKISEKINIKLSPIDRVHFHIYNKMKKYANVTWSCTDTHTTIYDKTHDIHYNGIDYGMSYKLMLDDINKSKLELIGEYIARYGWCNENETVYIHDANNIVDDFTNHFFKTINKITTTYIKFRDFNFNKENLRYYAAEKIYINYNDDRYNDIEINSLLFSGLFIWKYNVCSNTECVRIAQLIWNYLFVDEIKKYRKYIPEYCAESLVFEQNELNFNFIYYLSNVWAYIFKFDCLNKEQVTEIMQKQNHAKPYDVLPHELYKKYEDIVFDDDVKIAQLFNNIFALKFNIQNISNIDKTILFDLKNTITEIYKTIFKTTVICSKNDNYKIFNIIEKILKNHS